jgi:hypothetical protein
MDARSREGTRVPARCRSRRAGPTLFLAALLAACAAPPRPAPDPEPPPVWRPVHAGEAPAALVDLGPPVPLDRLARTPAEAARACPDAVVDGALLFRARSLPGRAFGAAEPRDGDWYLKVEPTTGGFLGRVAVALTTRGGFETWRHVNEDGEAAESSGYVTEVDERLPSPPLPAFVRASAAEADPCWRE